VWTNVAPKGRQVIIRCKQLRTATAAHFSVLLDKVQLNVGDVRVEAQNGVYGLMMKKIQAQKLHCLRRSPFGQIFNHFK